LQGLHWVALAESEKVLTAQGSQAVWLEFLYVPGWHPTHSAVVQGRGITGVYVSPLNAYIAATSSSVRAVPYSLMSSRYPLYRSGKRSDNDPFPIKLL
jgi:hypothetical protein